MKLRNVLNGLLLSGCLMLSVSAAQAYGVSKDAGDENTALLKMRIDQQSSELVIFYQVNGHDRGVNRPTANIYIDGEMHSALKPGQYTHFCLKGGQHTIEHYYNDAPYYYGKKHPKMKTELPGNQMYFLAVTGDTNYTVPMSLDQVQGMAMLKNAKASTIRSRASSVVKCENVVSEGIQSTNSGMFKSSLDVPFRVGMSTENDILTGGKDIIQRVARQLLANKNDRVILIGWRDNFGIWRDYKQLSMKRANTVKSLLIEQGVEAQKIQVQYPENSPLLAKCRNYSNACAEKNRRVTLFIVE